VGIKLDSLLLREKEIIMGQRRDRLNRRLEKQATSRRDNAPRKAKERLRKAARGDARAALVNG
jgi:hypothetical protein